MIQPFGCDAWAVLERLQADRGLVVVAVVMCEKIGGGETARCRRWPA